MPPPPPQPSKHEMFTLCMFDVNIIDIMGEHLVFARTQYISLGILGPDGVREPVKFIAPEFVSCLGETSRGAVCRKRLTFL